ncbi:unnamed protein product [Miscanthus lutarioriparius]|uniref:DNA-directed DNA polymerase family A palm domain-containing protein n=1 Tax=Miscanthus lutarioriparius TaxID=422564 RepID=A0A811SMB8_9POAL|nr:unnamed protein product [Miscanthus lutarioriparius]
MPVKAWREISTSSSELGSSSTAPPTRASPSNSLHRAGLVMVLGEFLWVVEAGMSAALGQLSAGEPLEASVPLDARFFVGAVESGSVPWRAGLVCAACGAAALMRLALHRRGPWRHMGGAEVIIVVRLPTWEGTAPGERNFIWAPRELLRTGGPKRCYTRSVDSARWGRDSVAGIVPVLSSTLHVEGELWLIGCHCQVALVAPFIVAISALDEGEISEELVHRGLEVHGGDGVGHEQEIPIADVCETFKVARGMIQALQENAGRFASMVSAFCQRLGWNDLEGLVSKFQNRVSFGVRAEIAELTSIPFVKGSRARALYKSGLMTPVAIAEASIPEIAKALLNLLVGLGKTLVSYLMQFGIAKKIKNGARKIVLEEAEAARVAAFSAFKSLGVEVPQFTAPPLAAIEDYPTRDTIDQAKSNKLAFGTHARDDKNKNNCSDYATPRASTYSLRKDANPAPSIQMKENAELSKNVKITRQGAAASLSTEIADGLSSRDVADKGPVHAYNFPGGFDCFLDQWSAASKFFFDVHFIKRSLKPSSNLFEVFGLAVCWENSPIYYCNFPKDLVTTGNNDFREMWGYFQRRWEKITDIMQQKSVQKMTWNLKIQIQALKSPYISCQRLERFHLDHKMLDKVEVLDNSYMLLSPISVYNGLDICLLAWVLWPDEESRTVPNLEKFVKRRLHSEAAAAANRDGRWRNQMHKAAHNGCCRRAAQTRALYTVLKKLLTQNLSDLVETIEAPLVNVLADMELWGIGADMDACLRARHIITKKLKELEKEAYRLAGKNFSLNATADIADILYTHLKLPVPKGCEKGKLHPSTDKQSLDHLRDQHPIIPVIKEHRTLAKLLNGTLWSICSRAQLCTQSQRYIIHGNWLQTSTATGRLSMEEPNLQCVEHLVEFDTGKSDKDYSSVSVDYHHKINARDFFIPTKENWLFVTADYSQIELRLMAHFSKDPTLVELLSKPDGDVFTMIASRWADKEEALISSKERKH